MKGPHVFHSLNFNGSSAFYLLVEPLLLHELLFNLSQHVFKLAFGVVEIHFGPQSEVLECKPIVNASSESLIRDRPGEVLAVVSHN